LKIQNLRGNVGTRIEKAEAGTFDAIILAAAGLKRLHFANQIRQYFDPRKFIPAIGQGVIGIECRENDIKTRELISVLDHLPTRICVTAERAMNQQFGGNCQIPIAAYAILENQQLRIDGLVGKPDGSKILRSFKIGKSEEAEQLGIALAEELFSQGAKEILNKI
jgi:hydroxymethylbilane synthase